MCLCICFRCLCPLFPFQRSPHRPTDRPFWFFIASKKLYSLALSTNKQPFWTDQHSKGKEWLAMNSNDDSSFASSSLLRITKQQSISKFHILARRARFGKTCKGAWWMPELISPSSSGSWPLFPLRTLRTGIGIDNGTHNSKQVSQLSSVSKRLVLWESYESSFNLVILVFYVFFWSLACLDTCFFLAFGPISPGRTWPMRNFWSPWGSPSTRGQALCNTCLDQFQDSR